MSTLVGDLEGLARSPDAVFGMLLAGEGQNGLSVTKLAQLVGVGRKQLASVLDDARNGALTKARAFNEVSMVSKKDRRGTDSGPVAQAKQEVLVHRWMRRIVRHLVQHGVIEHHKVAEFLGAASWLTCSGAMEAIRRQLKPHKISFRHHSSGKTNIHFTVDDENRAKLRALIAANWRVAA